MKQEIVNFMTNNGFSEYIYNNKKFFVKVFTMCPHCKILWGMKIDDDGSYEITDEFSHICWKNGHKTLSNLEPMEDVFYIPGNGGRYLPEKVTSIKDVQMLLEFIETYKH